MDARQATSSQTTTLKTTPAPDPDPPTPIHRAPLQSPASRHLSASASARPRPRSCPRSSQRKTGAAFIGARWGFRVWDPRTRGRRWGPTPVTWRTRWACGSWRASRRANCRQKRWTRVRFAAVAATAAADEDFFDVLAPKKRVGSAAVWRKGRCVAGKNCQLRRTTKNCVSKCWTKIVVLLKLKWCPDWWWSWSDFVRRNERKTLFRKLWIDFWHKKKKSRWRWRRSNFFWSQSKMKRRRQSLASNIATESRVSRAKKSNLWTKIRVS